ncbi:MAG TPA: hypothetical protein VIJ52_06690 [Pseudolabrys sp.]
MNPTHAAFFEAPEAKVLRTIVMKPEYIPQFELLSRLECPAVQAVIWDIEPVIERFDPTNRNRAIQSVGALIGDVLTARGFRIARDSRGEKKRGRVRKARFVKSGTIWELPSHAEKLDPDFEKTMEVADELMDEYRDTLATLAK